MYPSEALSWCETLEYKVERLEKIEQDYNVVCAVLGNERVDCILVEQKEQERLKLEAEKEKRKLLRKNQRDVR